MEVGNQMSSVSVTHETRTCSETNSAFSTASIPLSRSWISSGALVGGLFGILVNGTMYVGIFYVIVARVSTRCVSTQASLSITGWFKKTAWSKHLSVLPGSSAILTEVAGPVLWHIGTVSSSESSRPTSNSALVKSNVLKFLSLS